MTDKNKPPACSKQERLQELISVASARETLAPLLGENTFGGHYTISAKPGIGKSLSIPTAMYIAGDDTTRILCLHQDFPAANRAREATARLPIWRFEEMPGLRVVDPTQPNVGLDQDPSNRIIYITNGSLLYSATSSKALLDWCTHLVMDDVHEWSIDQQIVLFNLAHIAGPQRALDLVKVYMTAFADTSIFATRIVATQPLWNLQIDVLWVGGDTPQPQVLSSADELGAANYCSWVKTTIDTTLEGAKKPRRILVFCPTMNSVAVLTTRLSGSKRDVYYVDPRIVASVGSVPQSNNKGHHLIVLMRPHFGARTILDADDVFCPSTNENTVFDVTVAQPCLMVQRLAADRIAFLESHAQAPGARVHHGFAADTRRPSTARPVWLQGDCIEYFLKDMHAGAPKTSLLVVPSTPGPYHMSPPSAVICAAERQMWLQNLCDFPNPEEDEVHYQVTSDGTRVVEWMLATGLGWATAMTLHKYTENGVDGATYTDIAASTLICIAALDAHAPSVLECTNAVVGANLASRAALNALDALDIAVDTAGIKANFPTRATGDLMTWLLVLEHARAAANGPHHGIPGWTHVTTVQLGPLTERTSAFAKKFGVAFQIPTPQTRLEQRIRSDYSLGLQAIHHLWNIHHISRLVCVPILDGALDAWENGVKGWDVGSRLMVFLDPTSLLDFRRARNLVMNMTDHPTMLLTYRDIYQLPSSAGHPDCLYGVSGLTFMHPHTVDLIPLSLGFGEELPENQTLADLVTNGMDSHFDRANMVGGRDEFLKGYPSLAPPTKLTREKERQEQEPEGKS